MLILSDRWLEFCPPCGDTEILTNTRTGETATISAVFASIENDTATEEAKDD
jgi:hypothetical protein